MIMENMRKDKWRRWRERLIWIMESFESKLRVYTSREQPWKRWTILVTTVRAFIKTKTGSWKTSYWQRDIKMLNLSQTQWLMSVILAIWESEIGRITGQGQLGKKFARPCLNQRLGILAPTLSLQLTWGAYRGGSKSRPARGIEARCYSENSKSKKC
jgi:hypothetical protein